MDVPSVTVNVAQNATNTGTWERSGKDVVAITASIGTVTQDVNGSWAWSLDSASLEHSGEVTITATDSDGATGLVTFSLVVNGIMNVAPQIDSLSTNSADCEHAANGLVTLTGQFSDENLTDTHSLVINWGDGNLQTIPTNDPQINQTLDTFTVSHHYATGGIFMASVTVVDNAGDRIGKRRIDVAGASVQNGVLTIIGTGLRDTVHIDRHGDQLRVRLKFDHGQHGQHDDDNDDHGHGHDNDDHDGECGNGNDDHDGGHGQHGHGDEDGNGYATLEFPLSSITSIQVMLCGGDDRLKVDADVTISVMVDGGAGDDQLETGSGADTITDLLGNNNVRGGRGNDTVTTGAGADDIRGDEGDDYIDAGAGADDLEGGNGNDIVLGGIGNDYLDGGQGRDILIAGLGDRTRLVGNQGDDVLIAGTTSWDSNSLELTQIFAEWNSSGSFATRVANLKTGSGLTGGSRLDGNNGATGNGLLRRQCGSTLRKRRPRRILGEYCQRQRWSAGLDHRPLSNSDSKNDTDM